MNFDIEAYCDQGGLRQANEDMVTIDGVIVDSSPDRAPACEGATDHLLLVADGMGGHPGGLAASALAAKYLGDLWMAEREALDIVSALRATNRAIYEAMAKSSEIRGMGTTIAGVHLLGTRLRWFNVGDSRVYVYRGGALIQLSVDHAIGEGDIYPAGTLTQCLGGSATFIEIEPSMGDAEILANDKVIICTDGVSGVLDGEQIAQACAASDLHTTSLELRSAVWHRGAPDNIGYILLRAVSVQDAV